MNINPNYRKSKRKQALPINEPAYLRENPSAIQHMNQTPDNIRAALGANGRMLKYISPMTEEWIALATDTSPEAVLEVENPSAELMKKCVRLAPYLVLLDDERFKDPELIDLAVTSCPELCEKDEIKVRLTYDMIMHAIEADPLAIRFIDELFLRDTHINTALNLKGSALQFVPVHSIDQAKLAITHGSAEFVKVWNPDLALFAVTTDPMFLEHVPEELRTQEVVLAAVSANGLSLEFVAGEVCDFSQVDELDEFLKNAYDGDRADLELANNIKKMTDGVNKFDKLVGNINKVKGTDTKVVSEMANII